MQSALPAPDPGPAVNGSSTQDGTWPPRPITPPHPVSGWQQASGVGPEARGSMSGTWLAGIVLVALGAFLLLGRWIPDVGQYAVLGIGLIMLIVFFATDEYGFLVPGGIVSGIGAGIPLSLAYAGQLGAGLFLLAMGAGFLLIWVLAMMFRLPERHPWPVVPGLVLGTIGAALAAGERGQGVADAIATGWPVILVLAGLMLMVGSFRRRPA
jgi:hypothetical protein